MPPINANAHDDDEEEEYLGPDILPDVKPVRGKGRRTPSADALTSMAEIDADLVYRRFNGFK